MVIPQIILEIGTGTIGRIHHNPGRQTMTIKLLRTSNDFKTRINPDTSLKGTVEFHHLLSGLTQNYICNNTNLFLILKVEQYFQRFHLHSQYTF